ncbi:YybH family protein [Aquariibacter albus]|uniref:Nuclear transport factor 2 family protein n=1 Tax=Aquariibacter albus TaxID=2759899 RepID=A0A839HMP3_9BURK|nr:nuclear transport factor 2 family protein [Aquariibacter albus]MBB1163296.1 nuclear transport factor 2 family protein [Aquariibacter albus]
MPVPPPVLPLLPDDVEASFYDAMQTGDLEKLMAVWAEDEAICCIHPGGPALHGAEAIRSSFAEIFARGPVDLQPVAVRRLRGEETAVHQVVEAVRLGSGSEARSVQALASNVYLLTPQGWRMVLHHASPAPAAAAALGMPAGSDHRPVVLH